MTIKFYYKLSKLKQVNLCKLLIKLPKGLENGKNKMTRFDA